MIIRQTQIDQLRDALTDSLVDRLANYYWSELPEGFRALSRAELLKFVEASVTRARFYGITTDSGTAKFVGLALLFGMEFDAVPEMGAILRATDVESQLDELVSRVSTADVVQYA